MNNYTIAITTFSLRLGIVTDLIRQVRTHTDRNILLCINGEKDGNFNNDYRKSILNICSEYDNIFPIFFVETRGLAKMWNTLLSHSDNHHVMLLNDDIIVQSSDVFDKAQNHINSPEFTGVALINSSFSHYIVDRRVIDGIGYFDERLLGFGEEDGDLVYRLLKNNYNYNLLWVSGLINMISPIRDENIKKGSINNVEHKYSNHNRKFVYEEKYKSNMSSPFRGMFDTPMDQELHDDKIYPYEIYFWENKNKLYK